MFTHINEPFNEYSLAYHYISVKDNSSLSERKPVQITRGKPVQITRSSVSHNDLNLHCLEIFGRKTGRKSS